MKLSLGKGKRIRATDKAMLVELEDHGELWIPYSVVHDDSEVWDDSPEGEVVVEEWWADKQGLVQ